MSRTNHPRIHGTHRAASIGREQYERGAGQVAAWGTPTRVVEGFRATARERIQEGLASMAAPIDLGEQYDLNYLHGLAWDEYLERLEEEADIADEVASHMAMMEEADHEDPDEDPSYANQFWLAIDLDEAFPEGGYVIEGSTPQVSERASGYYRVYEAARLLDVNTSTLVALLRSEGEWVAGGAAYVAKPVIDAYVGSPALEQYQPRTRTWAEQLTAIQRTLAAPRPRYTNPFSPSNR